MSNLKDSQLSSEQQMAVELCCDFNERIVGVTGGAGTGKTSVLGKAYEELKQEHGASSIALCAPTGRAAKRVQELTGINATTIHRLLEFPTPDDPVDGDEPIENKPKRNAWNPLTQRVVIVDEASMVGPSLYAQLMDAVPRNGIVRFFGDNNQLPPVESGIPPFLDILERRKSVTLTFNFRSDDYIVANALRILEGSVPQRNARFEIIYSDNPISELVRLVTPDFKQPDHQIILPTRKGNFGTLRCNPLLQLKLNGNGPFLRLDRSDEKDVPIAMRGGDKFLWTKNDYQVGIFNGEIGRVDWVNVEDGSLGLSLSEGYKEIPAQVKTFSPYHGHVIHYDPRRHIDHGFAITTHKSQGSEFKTVIYCITGGQSFLLNRQNFYTAVTRAKHQVILITDRRAMGLSLKKAKPNRA